VEGSNSKQHVIKTCPQCYRTFPEEIRFCGLCGAPLEERNTSAAIDDISTDGESSYIGSLIDGRYRVNRLIGRGGMGSVYEVDHIHMQKRLAMKLLHEDMVVRKQLISRFTREARAVSRLSNEHTVRVYDFGRYKAVFFLVMECLDGEDLEVILSREGALHWRRSLEIFDQVCESLAEAHGAGIIHRDLKPENIMIIEHPPVREFVKVLDFGLAKITENHRDVFSVHSQRDLFGTPFYMSPEQIRSEEIDPRADVYSLGCLLYRMLTNRHVYDAAYAFDVLRQHLTAQIPSAGRTNPSGGIPARVDRLVWRALAKRKENRFPDVETMRREIAGCLANPEGESLVVAAHHASVPEVVPEIDAELEARLQAFEESHQQAEARMHGAPELPPETAPPLPMGIEVPADPTDTIQDLQLPDGLYDPTSPIDEWKPNISSPDLDDDHDLERELEYDELVPTDIKHKRRAPTVPGAQNRRQEMPSPAFRQVRKGAPRLASPYLEISQTLRQPDLDAEPIEESLTVSDEMWFDTDEDKFAKRLRRRRSAGRVIAAFLFIAACAAGTYYWLNAEVPQPPTGEAEPNNHVGTANVLTPGLPVHAYLGKRLSRVESDRDYYKLDMGGPGRFLELSLTNIKNLDLYVDVLDGSGRFLTRVNYEGIGEDESMHRLRVPTKQALLVVSEAKAAEDAPTENVSDPYTLTAEVVDSLSPPGEVEPNDTAPAANAYKAGERVAGYLDGVRDVDYYMVSTDGVMDLRRWEIAVEAAGTLVPRISIYRVVGDDSVLVFSDEGSSGLLQTVYEEPSFPNPVYLIAVQHSRRGAHRGSYRFVADLLPPKPRIAHEPNDDRPRATSVAIGQETHGILEGTGDVDVFAIPVADPQHRGIEIRMDPVVRDRLRLSLSDVNKANVKEYPRRRQGRARVPQPPNAQPPIIKFKGDGETYYLTVKSRGRRDRDIAYSFRVVRVMTDDASRAVGGPGY